MWLFTIMTSLSLFHYANTTHTYILSRESISSQSLSSFTHMHVSIINNIQLKVHLTAHDTPHHGGSGVWSSLKLTLDVCLYYMWIIMQLMLSWAYRCVCFTISAPTKKYYGWRNGLYVRLSAFTDTFQSVLFMLSFYILFLLHTHFYQCKWTHMYVVTYEEYIQQLLLFVQM